MPITIKYPKNPNVDTAFVEQDDGTKNRALMIAPQDISTLELPNNPNSTKGYITVDGKKQRVILTADITGGGGGGSGLPDQTGHSGEFLTTDGTDASWAAVNALQNTATGTDSIATGTATAAGNQSTAFGESAEASTQDSTAYGYDATAKTNIGATAVGASSQAVGQWSSAFGFEAQARNTNCIQLGSGTNTTGGTFKVGFKNNGNYELLNNQGFIPTDRLTNAINKYSSMPTASADYLGQIAQFTGTTDATYTHGYIYECVSDGGNPATYSWTAVSVQAGGSSLPSQTGNSGKFLTTDGTDASWSNNIQIGTSITRIGRATSASGNGSVVIGNNSNSGQQYTVALGGAASAGGNGAIAIGNYAFATAWGTDQGIDAIAIGHYAQSKASHAIQLGATGTYTTNSDVNTFKVANANGNFEIMDANGNLPADRLASTTGLADGNYRLRLTMTSGVPTLSWVAE